MCLQFVLLIDMLLIMLLQILNNMVIYKENLK